MNTLYDRRCAAAGGNGGAIVSPHRFNRVLSLFGPFVLVLAGCQSSSELTGPARVPAGAGASGVVLLTLNAVPSAVMTASFEGRIVLDRAGCLRLAAPKGATVIWPKGFAVVERGDDVWIRDAEGIDLARIGEEFRLGGGGVDRLHPESLLSASDRQRAADLCPGSYWIVGGVPRSN